MTRDDRHVFLFFSFQITYQRWFYRDEPGNHRSFLSSVNSSDGHAYVIFLALINNIAGSPSFTEGHFPGV